MRMRGVLVCASVMLVSWFLSPWPAAALLSKSYLFRPGVFFEVGAATDDGLRLDTARFQMPSETGVRTVPQPTVDVTISNSSESSKKVGIAVALFDEQGRMVAVASGGTKLMPLKAGRQKAYRLVFTDLNTEASRASTFQISLESKP